MILNDDLESYKNIPDPATKLPLTGSNAQQKIVANKRLAAILSKMIEDFALMSTLSPTDNKTQEEAAISSYKEGSRITPTCLFFPHRSSLYWAHLMMSRILRHTTGSECPQSILSTASSWLGG
jgi:hypothetical protein